MIYFKHLQVDSPKYLWTLCRWKRGPRTYVEQVHPWVSQGTVILVGPELHFQHQSRQQHQASVSGTCTRACVPPPVGLAVTSTDVAVHFYTYLKH